MGGGGPRRRPTGAVWVILAISPQTSHFGHFGQPSPNQGGPPEKKCHLRSCLNQRDRARPFVYHTQLPANPAFKCLFLGCRSTPRKNANNSSPQAGSDQRACPREFSTTEKQIAMMPLSVATLTNARKPNFSALIFSDVKAPTGNSADYNHAAAEDTGRMGLIVCADEMFYAPPAGRGSDRTTMAVVAEINDDADHFLRSVVSGRPLNRSVMQTAARAHEQQPADRAPVQHTTEHKRNTRRTSTAAAPPQLPEHREPHRSRRLASCAARAPQMTPTTRQLARLGLWPPESPPPRLGGEPALGDGRFPSLPPSIGSLGGTTSQARFLKPVKYSHFAWVTFY